MPPPRGAVPGRFALSLFPSAGIREAVPPRCRESSVSASWVTAVSLTWGKYTGNLGSWPRSQELWVPGKPPRSVSEAGFRASVLHPGWCSGDACARLG